jgi:hypothetical protein
VTTAPSAAPGHTGFSVSVADVASTAAAFGRVHGSASGAAAGAASALGVSAGMAGDDGPMAAWRTRYDAVARATWAACGAAVGTLHDVAAKLVETGNAYLSADHASTPGAGGAPSSLAPVAAATPVPGGPPSATGPSGGSAPPEVAEFWPGGDPARLRQAAAAWTALAEALDDAALDADRAFRTLTAHNTGQAFSAMTAFWASRYALCAGDPLFNVAPIGARTLGQGCTALADLVEHTRTTIANAPHDASEDAVPVELLGLVPGPPGRVGALLGRAAAPILASGFAEIARGQYLSQLDELTRQLSPELEGRLDRAAAIDRRTDDYGVSVADVGEVAGLGLAGSGWDGVAGPTPTPDSINVPARRATHILYGDKTGGGHLSGVGKRDKSEFPPDWKPERIMSTAVSIARDPHVAPTFQPGKFEDRWKIEEVRDQVLIRVIVNKDGQLVTAVPLSGPGVIRNPK